MTTAQVVETSVTVNNNSPIQDYVHSDDQTQPTFEMIPGFKFYTVLTFSVDSYINIYISVKPTYTQSSVKLSFVTIARKKDEQSITTVANKIQIPKDHVMTILLSLRSLNHHHRP